MTTLYKIAIAAKILTVIVQLAAMVYLICRMLSKC